MSETPRALQILLEEQPFVASSVSPDLVATIYKIEARVQFDDDRREAARKIRDAVTAALEKESLKGSTDGDAS
jgi:hypothetical protein